MKLTAAEQKELVDVAQALRIAPEWLAGVINFETAGTWDPKIKNPLSSARGLIQFTNATAVNLGFKDSADLVARFPTIQSQLRGPVLKYLSSWAPFKDEKAFYFSVFLPKYRNAGLDTVMYADDPAALSKFRAANPGIITVGDYYLKLKKAFAKQSKFVPTGPGGAIVLGAAVAAITLWAIYRS